MRDASAPDGTKPPTGTALQRLFNRVVHDFVLLGTLTIEWADATQTRYGSGAAPAVAARITSSAAIRRMLLDPTLALGELYMDGSVQPVGCTMYDILDFIGANLRTGLTAVPGIRLAAAIGQLRRRLDQYNPVGRSQRNVAHHYDLDERLYALFLDADRQYSCAYFRTGHETLDQAQEAKKRHVAAKLCLTRPGLHVLDVGCGWGGLALTLARDHGCRVTGITLSREQLAVARDRAAEQGLADRVQFELMDYRSLTGAYDRIVSVGMFEHVGIGQYPAFFAAVRRCLAPDGIALLHTIGRSDGPFSTNRWIAKYIFPGGYSPALSEIVPSIEQAGLVLTDLEVLRRHYAMTLRAWRDNFAQSRQAIAALYDERFCRMFEFYLAVSEVAFRRLTHVVFQIQLTRELDATPLTRDYISHADRAADRIPAHAQGPLVVLGSR